MRGLRQDVSYALRLYRRTPGASLMVILVLAVTLACTAAFLSLYFEQALKPEPGFEPGGRIVSVECSCGWGGLPLDLIERITDDAVTIEHVAGVAPLQLQVGPDREALNGELVTRDFFPGLRPKLAQGRGFTEAEHRADSEPVVVISWRLWQENFGGQPDVLGRTLEIERRGNNADVLPPQDDDDKIPKEFRIVGVMAPDFGDRGQTQYSVWIPLERGISIAVSAPPQMRARMMRSWALRGVARISRGTSNAAVLNELKGRFSDEDAMKQPGARYAVIDGIVQDIAAHREVQRQLGLFLGASILLALVASTNVSLFLLARAPGRRRELAIRMAVGAPIGRLTRQLISEAAVLVVAASACGLAVSTWLAKLLSRLPFLQAAQWHSEFLLDWRALGMICGFLLLVTLVVSVVPALELKRLGIARGGGSTAARASVSQRIVGTAQIAVAGALGGAALAFAWHLLSGLLAYPGYRTDDLYIASFSNRQDRPLTGSARQLVGGIVDSARRREAFAALPGVKGISMAAAAPGIDMGSSEILVPDPNNLLESVRVRSLLIDSRYVDLLGLRLMQGRNLDDGESGVLVNQTFARRFFGREEIAGETLPTQFASVAGFNRIARIQGIQVAGVLEDFSFRHPLAAVEPMIFTTAGSSMSGVVIIKSSLVAAGLNGQFVETAHQLDLKLIGDIVSLRKVRSDILAPDRARGYLVIFAAALVVLLASLGFYGTQQYLVSAGRREYAIRASLGAGPRLLGRLVIQRGLLLGLPGLVLSAPMAFIVVAWLRGDYVTRQISPLIVSVAVAAGVIVLLLSASIGPARLARNTQPALLLRGD